MSRTSWIAAALAAALAATLWTGPALAADCLPGKQRDRFPNPNPITVYFDEGSARVADKDKAELAKVAKQAKDHFVQHICLAAQTSKSGDAKANERLARQRADAVAAILRQNGVKASFGYDLKGEAFGGALGFLPKTQASDRRVTVMFMQ
jgi:outer membrane protein OmpA-like peptidoglycan-associated protein